MDFARNRIDASACIGCSAVISSIPTFGATALPISPFCAPCLIPFLKTYLTHRGQKYYRESEF